VSYTPTEKWSGVNGIAPCVLGLWHGPAFLFFEPHPQKKLAFPSRILTSKPDALGTRPPASWFALERWGTKHQNSRPGLFPTGSHPGTFWKRRGRLVATSPFRSFEMVRRVRLTLPEPGTDLVAMAGYKGPPFVPSDGIMAECAGGDSSNF